jgi:hypothetical protein
MDSHAMEKRQRTRVGAVALIGLGGAMLAHQVAPGFLHGPLVLATIALTFGALYTLAGFMWAKVPAMFFSVLSGFVFLVSLPGQPLRMWWPLLIVLAGLWIMRRDRRWAF